MCAFWLTPDVAARALAAIESGAPQVTVSLDLGLSAQRILLSREGATAAPGACVGVPLLRQVAAARRTVFMFEHGRLSPVEIAADQFYKLVPTDGAPTIEISGIQMHRTTGTDPFRNAFESARTVVRRGDRVLDTCGGLGYTAICAARLGAVSVVSVEVDASVLAIARLSPWSREYFSNPHISIIGGDVAEFVTGQPDGGFDSVIHDPPRFSRAGELYGGAFYAALARALRRRGRLFHYTGEPYSRGRGRAFVPGVVRRLQAAGFIVRRAPTLQGLVGRVGPRPAPHVK